MRASDTKRQQLREANERYRALLDSVDDGFCLIEVIFDESGARAIDHRYLEVNAGFARQTGLSDVTGRTAREVTPALEAFWSELYGRVARTGEPIRVERESRALGRWFDVQATRVGAPERRRVAVLFHDTTVRREAEAALRQSEETARRGEEFARRVIDNLFAFVGVLDIDGTLLYVNEAPLKVADLSMEDVRGRRFWDCDWFTYSQEVSDRVRDACARAARGETVRCDLVGRVAGDGRLIIDFQIAPLRDESGRITHLIPSAVDITERVRATQELRRSEARLKRLFDTDLLGVIYWDVHGGIVDANDQFLRMVGYDRADLAAGRVSWARMTPPEHRAQDERALDEIRRTGRHATIEKEYVRKDGARVWVLVGSAFTKPPYGVGFVIDISQQKRAEARFRALADNIAQLVWMTDETGYILWYNRRWFEYTGTTFDQMQGGGWKEVHHPDHVERVTEKFRRHIASGEPWEDTFPLRGAGGEFRWFLSRAFPVRDERGRVVLWFGTNTDITAQRQAEESLREADRRKDEFIAVLAHELRNPLAPVRNSIHILRKLGLDEPRLVRARDVIDRQVTHMTRLIDDLLDVSRIARGKLALRQERCDVAAIARQTAEDYRPSLESGGLDVIIDAPGPMWVEGDPVRLAQMIGNLLQNAGRFTTDGGRVEVRAAPDAACGVAKVVVRDTGEGMDPALLARLFEPFSQAEQGLAREKGGLGLGLALTKGLAELHGGAVTAHSDGLGRGSTFTMTIPLRPARRERRAREMERMENRGLHILVIEDNRDTAATLGEVLELDGHVVELAFDGTSGLAAAHAFHPDVVISDIGLPGELDGYGVARRMRADPSFDGAYLVALSGYTDETARARSQEAGFDVHFAKPPDLAALERTLEQVHRR